jgi:hypothetical protein
MTISLDSFSDCGFPEEFVVWIVVLLFFVAVGSFVLLHIIVDEGFIRSRTWLPITFYIFHHDAYSKAGRVVRLVFLIAVFFMLLLLSTMPLLYQEGVFQCGQISIE